MSKHFIHDNFLLENKYAEELYHNYSKQQPIIDYHNHLSPQLIAEDKVFDNLTQVWINGDHYKWRAMRTLGINEKFITGDASDKDKFLSWSKTVPYTMRNPLYHWTHLELARYFGVYDLLNEKSAEKIYEEVSAKVKTKAYSTQNLLRKVNAEYVCTTEDPTDTLEFHQQIKKDINKAKLESAQKALNDTVLRAPYSGNISKIDLKNNQVIQQGNPVISMLALTKLEAKINLPSNIVAKAKVENYNNPIHIVLNAAPEQEIPAFIKEVSLEADPASQTYEVTFYFEYM